MQKLLPGILAHIARAVVRRQRPFVVGVTGSVGKTSTRCAIAVVLRVDRRVRSAPKNYNNEIGLPMAIIGGRAPGRSLIRWLAVAFHACLLGLRRDRSYPEALVLEYGADHPGDLAHLIAIARPDIAVVTAVGSAHAEFFGSIDRIAAEKRRLVVALASQGTAVLNRDDDLVTAMRDRTRARILTYGFHPESDVRGVEDQVVIEGGRPTGIAFKAIAAGSAVPVHLRDCLGRSHAAAALGAVAVGIASGMHLIEISHALAAYEPPPGRMRIISGIRGTTLIDDTYNASPLALASALAGLRDLPAIGRKIAILGDMLELGALTVEAHRHMGDLAASCGLAMLVTVGEAMRYAAVGARSSGMESERVVEFPRAADAGRFVQDRLESGDVVLVKGSQGMRMERVVQELMAEPLRAPELLCRQDREWLER